MSLPVFDVVEASINLPPFFYFSVFFTFFFFPPAPMNAKFKAQVISIYI